MTLIVNGNKIEDNRKLSCRSTARCGSAILWLIWNIVHVDQLLHCTTISFEKACYFLSWPVASFSRVPFWPTPYIHISQNRRDANCASSAITSLRRVHNAHAGCKYCLSHNDFSCAAGMLFTSSVASEQHHYVSFRCCCCCWVLIDARD